MKKIKKWIYEFIREAVNDEQDHFYTVFTVFDEKRKMMGEVCFTFKPSKGDIIEFDLVRRFENHSPENFFWLEVEKVVYSHRGRQGKIYGRKVQFT